LEKKFLHEFGFFHALVDDEVDFFLAGFAFGDECGSLVLFFDVRGELGFSAVTGFVLALHAPRSLGHGSGLAGFEQLHLVNRVLFARRAVQREGFGKIHLKSSNEF